MAIESGRVVGMEVSKPRFMLDKRHGKQIVWDSDVPFDITVGEMVDRANKLAEENAALKDELTTEIVTSVPADEHIKQLDEAAAQIETLQAELLLARAYVSEFTTLKMVKTPITYEVYAGINSSVEITRRRSDKWRIGANGQSSTTQQLKPPK